MGTTVGENIILVENHRANDFLVSLQPVASP